MLQRRANHVLAKQSAYVCIFIVIDDKVDSLDKLYMQEVISVSPSPIDDFTYVETVTNHEV